MSWISGEEHAGHGDDDGQPGDEDRAAGRGRGRLERRLVAAPGGPFLAFSLQVEHRVVDADREPDQEDQLVGDLVDRAERAREGDQAERREDGRKREQERDAGRDERPEDDQQDDQRHREREQPGLLEVVHEDASSSLSALASPNSPMNSCGCAV